MHSAQAEVDRTSRLVASLTSKDGKYSPYAAESQDLARRTALMKEALADDVDAAGLVDEVAAHLPPDVWLRSVALAMPTAKSHGSVSFTLAGVDGSSPAHWLEQMRSLGGVFSQVSGISSQASGHRSEVVFSSTASLAPGVVSGRAAALAVPR